MFYCLYRTQASYDGAVRLPCIVVNGDVKPLTRNRRGVPFTMTWESVRHVHLNLLSQTNRQFPPIEPYAAPHRASSRIERLMRFDMARLVANPDPTPISSAHMVTSQEARLPLGGAR